MMVLSLVADGSKYRLGKQSSAMLHHVYVLFPVETCAMSPLAINGRYDAFWLTVALL